MLKLLLLLLLSCAFAALAEHCWQEHVCFVCSVACCLRARLCFVGLSACVHSLDCIIGLLGRYVANNVDIFHMYT